MTKTGWRERLAAMRTGTRRAPLPAEALTFVALIALLYFHAGTALQAKYGENGLLMSEWGLLFLPALLFAFLGPFDPRRTLALRAPSPRSMLGALLVALGGIPIGWAIGWVQLQLFFREGVPKGTLQQLQNLLTANDLPRFLWLLLLAAVTPAFCEEAVFRGVLLQGLSREERMWRAVGLSALIFGAFHLSGETALRFLPTAWIGLLMAVVVWRTRSIFTSMLMHFLNNGISVLVISAPAFAKWVLIGGERPNWLLVAAAPLALYAGLSLLPRRETIPEDAAAVAVEDADEEHRASRTGG